MAQRQRKVMVVDDEHYVHCWLRKVLEERGYEVEVCADAEEGLARCARDPTRYGLVFMDVCFPEGAVGYGMARSIAALQPDGGPAIIGMTGHRAFYDMKESRRAGMADLILKPLFPHLVGNLADRHFMSETPPERV